MLAQQLKQSFLYYRLKDALVRAELRLAAHQILLREAYQREQEAANKWIAHVAKKQEWKQYAQVVAFEKRIARIQRLITRLEQKARK